MPRYSVTATITVSVTTEVEAKNAKEAKRIALEDRPIQGLCHQCSDGDREYASQWCLCDGLDGEVNEQVVSVEEVA